MSQNLFLTPHRTIFANDCRARIAHVVTSDHTHAHNFDLRHPHVSYGCRGSNLHDTIRRKVMTYASRARFSSAKIGPSKLAFRKPEYQAFLRG